MEGRTAFLQLLILVAVAVELGPRANRHLPLVEPEALVL
jgi:hypothetical protein